MLGDPLLPALEGEVGGIVSFMKSGFVLDKQSVLRSDYDRVEMLNINERHQSNKEDAHTTVLQIVFSLSGETIYVATGDDLLPTTKVTVWNVSNSDLIAEKKVDVLSSSCNCLLAVKGGVLITTSMGTLQMWNFGLVQAPPVLDQHRQCNRHGPYI